MTKTVQVPLALAERVLEHLSYLREQDVIQPGRLMADYYDLDTLISDGGEEK
jgi:hypothetical protein